MELSNEIKQWILAIAPSNEALNGSMELAMRFVMDAKSFIRLVRIMCRTE